MAITLVDFEGGTIGQNVVSSGGVATVTGTPKYVAGIHGDKGIGITAADYVTLTCPTTDWSGSLYVKITAAPTSGATRLVVIRDSAAKWLSYLRFHQDGTFQYTNESALAGTIGTYTVGATYRIDWQVNQVSKSVMWRITTEGGTVSNATGVWTTSSGVLSSQLAVGASGAGAAGTFTADTFRYDPQLVWMDPYVAAAQAPPGVFMWDGTKEVAVSQSGAFPVDLTYTQDPGRPEFIVHNDYVADPGNRDTMQIWSHGELTWWVNEWGGLRIRVAENSPWDAPLRLIGATNQSGDYIEFLDSTRTHLLARVTATGKIVAPNVSDAPTVILNGDEPLPAGLLPNAVVGRKRVIGGGTPSSAVYNFFDGYTTDAAASSADGWTAIVGDAPTYKAAAAWTGHPRGLQATQNASQASYMQENFSITGDEFYARIRLKVSATMTANVRVFQSSAVNGGLRHGVRLASSGKIDIVDTGVAIRYTSATAYPLNQWFDLGIHVKAGPSGTGHCFVKVYTDPTSNVPVETLGGTTGDWAGTGQALNGARIGIQTTNAATNTVLYGMYARDSATWIPAAPAALGSTEMDLAVYDGVEEIPVSGGTGDQVLVVDSLANIPPGTPSGTVIVVSATAGGNTPPIASFTTSVNQLAVSVNGAASSDPGGSIAGYSWDWGDGTAATSGVTSSHTYAANGTYTITLTVTDNLGDTDTDSKQVTVTGSTTAASAPSVVSSAYAYGGTGVTLTIAKPASLQDGDYLVMAFRGQTSATGTELTLPAGWTRIGPAFVAPNSTVRYNGWFGYRVTTAASEPASYSFSVNAGQAGSRLSGGIIAVRGVNTDPVVSSAAFTAISNIAATSTPAVTTAANSLVLTSIALETTATNVGTVPSTPSGWTKQFQVNGPVADGSASASWLHVYSKTSTVVESAIMNAAVTGPAATSPAAGALVLRGI